MKILRGYGILLLVFLWSPLFFLVYKGLNLTAFQRLFENQDLLIVFLRSLCLAIVTAIISTSLAMATAFAFPHQSRWMKRLMQFGIFLPMVLPEIAFGISFLVWFTKIGIPLGWTTLIFAHIAFTFSYSVLVLRSSVERIEWSFADAARDLGASSFGVLRHAIIPQLLPGIVASALMAFSLSLDDFLVSLFVKGVDQVTLPIKIYSMMRYKVGPEVYALFVVLFSISVVSVILSQLWQLKSQKSSQ